MNETRRDAKLPVVVCIGNAVFELTEPSPDALV